MRKPVNESRNAQIKAMRAQGVSAKQVALHFGLTEARIYMIVPVPEHLKKPKKPKVIPAETVQANLVNRIDRPALQYSTAHQTAIARAHELYPSRSANHSRTI